MSRLQEFIDTLEDFELLALYKYRYDSFMKGSQQKIMVEIEKRGLQLNKLDVIIAKSKGSDNEIHESICCPRCYSRKFYHAHETDLISIKEYGFEISNDFKTCLVCLYSQDKKIYEKEKKRAWSVFGRLKFIKNRN